MSVDVNALWDYNQPQVSEQRFIEAREKALPDERLILETQIARSYGMRKDFAKARAILARLEPSLKEASPEAQARYHLELGRTYASTTHSKDQLTPEALDKARTHFTRAFDIASAARRDGVAIDALHMMVVVDSEPRQQIEWNRKAIAYMERSTQAEAPKWEGTLRNNLGYALHKAGDYDAALEQFRLSRAAYERAGRAQNVRYADWMIPWTYRAQGRSAEALALQLALERAWEAAGEKDPYVFQELEILYRAQGDEKPAAEYAEKRKHAG